MLPGLQTVAPVPYARNVKDMVSPPKNRVVLALSCIHCLSYCQKSSQQRAFRFFPLIPSFGGIGHAVSLAAPGYVGNVAIWSRWKPHPFRHFPQRLHFSRERSERIGG
jgi:hypothetical protein